MKSALEIAMEKTAAIGEKAREELGKLTPEQREEAEKIKKVYEGKLAERDVMYQQELQKLTGGAPLDLIEAQLPPEARAVIDDVRKKYREDREALEKERDEKVEAVKKKA